MSESVTKYELYKDLVPQLEVGYTLRSYGLKFDKRDLNTQGQVASATAKLSRSAKRSMEGKIPHWGIVLDITEDMVVLAAMATFGDSGSLDDKVAPESLPYWVAVAPNQHPSSAAKPTVTRIALDDPEDPAHPWINIRTDHEFSLNDDKLKAIIMGDRYSLEDVKKIKGYIAENKHAVNE